MRFHGNVGLVHVYKTRMGETNGLQDQEDIRNADSLGQIRLKAANDWRFLKLVRITFHQ